jgi:hypothetical protein
MNKICTDLSQSKKLIELGINVNTADMCWSLFTIITNGNKDIKQVLLPTSYGVVIKQSAPDFIERHPAWSLSALLGMMPKSICIKQSEHSGYFYFLEWQFANDNSLRYVGHDGKCLIDIYSDHDVKWKDSIDTAFEMICWLKENNKL